MLQRGDSSSSVDSNGVKARDSNSSSSNKGETPEARDRERDSVVAATQILPALSSSSP